MSVLRNTTVNRKQLEPLVLAGDMDGIERLFQETYRVRIWRWWHDNRNTRWKAKLWIFRPSVKVESLRWVVEGIAGPDPFGGNSPAPEA